MDKLLVKHVFCFNEDDNGGEAFCLTTEIFANGDPGGYYITQKLSLNSYLNRTDITLAGAIMTPGELRKLADQLEAVEKKAAKYDR